MCSTLTDAVTCHCLFFCCCCWSLKAPPRCWPELSSCVSTSPGRDGNHKPESPVPPTFWYDDVDSPRTHRESWEGACNLLLVLLRQYYDGYTSPTIDTVPMALFTLYNAVSYRPRDIGGGGGGGAGKSVAASNLCINTSQVY